MQRLLQWKSNGHYTVFVYICSFRYAACNAHVSFSHLWPAPLYNISPYYPIKDTTVQQAALHISCALEVSLCICLRHFSFQE